MANTTELLIEDIDELLEQEPDGLEVAEIVEKLSAKTPAISERGVRNLLNRLVKEGKLMKRRGRPNKPGARPYVYCHPKLQPRQLEIPGLEKYEILSKTELEEGEIDPQEKQRQERARSVLENIAAGHINQESYAQAIIKIAPQLAEENPVELIVQMAQWVVDELNQLGDKIQQKVKRGATEEANKLAITLDSHLGWARSYFQQFWRLDRRVEGWLDEIPGILELPAQPRDFKDGKRARLDAEKAKERLKQRIFGNKIVEERVLPTCLHKAAVGTDASVADLYLEHTQGSFIAPDPVVVTTAAAALITHSDNAPFEEYQDFEIFPDKLGEYDDYQAAVKGLVLSPKLKSNNLLLDEGKYQHARAAAMDLRQYEEEFRVLMKQAEWRTYGHNSLLGNTPRPTLIIRDGRVLPLEHRLQDYESGGLFGQIIHNQIEKFKQVFHNTVLGADEDITYGAAVKNPEISWLAPLVFWYLHTHSNAENGGNVKAEDVYQFPFSDTAVSHLLFLGIANKSKQFAANRMFVTCRVLRRFSDIVLKGEHLPAAISENGQIRTVQENKSKDWKIFLEERILKKRKNYDQNILEIDDYKPLIYLCSQVGVSMCYAAPTLVYEMLSRNPHHSGHFLLPRLEVAISTERLERNSDHEQEKLEGLLCWLATGHIHLDRAHTQSGFDTGNDAHRLPILVPDVTILAHEAATFTRTKLGEEVHDKLTALVAELRKRLEKGR